MAVAIELSHKAGCSQLALTGVVNIATAASFSKTAIQVLGQDQDATLDCSAATYLDCSILQQIILLQKGLREKGKQLLLAGASPEVRRDCQLVGLELP